MSPRPPEQCNNHTDHATVAGHAPAVNSQEFPPRERVGPCDEERGIVKQGKSKPATKQHPQHYGEHDVTNLIGPNLSPTPHCQPPHDGPRQKEPGHIGESVPPETHCVANPNGKWVKCVQVCIGEHGANGSRMISGT